ncbi:B-cell receptor CD22-like [Trachinotus anak]|uniref:B-cell receptor CD22-like n=1 Tax=Trachinotus anak TaxID=443729 RepID=UPI0039F2605A
MRGAALSMAAAAIGFVLLLPVSVIQGQPGWRVTYSPTYICAIKGSTVEIGCTYTHPYTVTQVQERFWFTKESNGFHVDLRTEPEYLGRVQYYFGENACTLTITDLRESDSAEYKFRFTTNQPGGKYTGSPGVTLFVADLQVQVMRSEVSRMSSNSAQFMCHSSCYLPADQAYIWYKNGQNIQETTSSHFYLDNFNPADSYSCAVRGHEDVPSPSVSGHWGVAYPYTQICAFKGSTVEIHCTYRYPSTMNGQHTQVKKQFWFTNLSDNEPVDLTNDPKYSGRVKYHCTENDCTLTISHLSESDSAEYKFRFTTNHQDGKYIGHPGVTLSVTDPQLQVNVRRLTVNWDSPWTELECHIRCRPLHDLSYIWYKNDQEVKGENSFYFVPFGSAEKYRCAIRGREHFRSPPVYAPQLPSVSVSPSGEIVEGSSVTLTCSSDANPAAKYTWYKENRNQNQSLNEGALSFMSIQSSDSGEYSCTAENDLGGTSTSTSIDVKYGPRLPSVSVSPSGEIVEGSSVTLTCSSGANPAATCTWYNQSQKLLQGQKGTYHFTSISSEDRGIYHCRCVNQYRQINSSSLFIDVQYAPKLPSVSVSPSGEIVEGSSVTLTCSSDANPAAKYTWYKENEDSPKASGQIFTITDITTKHRGNYYCEAQNTRGRHSSAFNMTAVAVFPKAWKSAVIGATPVVFFAIILSAFLLMRKRTTSKQSSEPGERPDYSDQCPPNQSEEQSELNYASVRFMRNETDPVYSNIIPTGPRRHEEEDVEYTVVKFNCSAPRTRDQETEEDPDALYSTVKKT